MQVLYLSNHNDLVKERLGIKSVQVVVHLSQCLHDTLCSLICLYNFKAMCVKNHHFSYIKISKVYVDLLFALEPGACEVLGLGGGFVHDPGALQELVPKTRSCGLSRLKNRNSAVAKEIRNNKLPVSLSDVDGFVTITGGKLGKEPQAKIAKLDPPKNVRAWGIRMDGDAAADGIHISPDMVDISWEERRHVCSCFTHEISRLCK
eukprot:XP_001704986.1 Hypothetical protein GL50803_31383 [Giardia lamblia ATCC 50803]